MLTSKIDFVFSDSQNIIIFIVRIQREIRENKGKTFNGHNWNKEKGSVSALITQFVIQMISQK